MSFKNKVVLITGASSGIGAAAAVMMTKEGASVAIVGRNDTKLKAVAERCEKAGKKPLIIKADVSNDDQAKTIIKKTIDTFSKLDVLVNNAGFSNSGSIADGKIVESYDEIMKTNVRAVIVLTTLAAPHLIKTKGNVVNISSVVALRVPMLPGFLPYSISKAALDHFTRGAALELGASGVRVNSVNPGPVKTDFLENAGVNDNNWDNFTKYTLLQRVSEPDEIATMIAFVASDKAVGVTGSVFVCDNGYMLKTE